MCAEMPGLALPFLLPRMAGYEQPRPAPAAFPSLGVGLYDALPPMENAACDNPHSIAYSHSGVPSGAGRAAAEEASSLFTAWHSRT